MSKPNQTPRKTENVDDTFNPADSLFAFKFDAAKGSPTQTEVENFTEFFGRIIESDSKANAERHRTALASHARMRLIAKRPKLRGRFASPLPAVELKAAGASDTHNPSPVATPVQVAPTEKAGEEPSSVPPAFPNLWTYFMVLFSQKYIDQVWAPSIEEDRAEFYNRLEQHQGKWVRRWIKTIYVVRTVRRFLEAIEASALGWIISLLAPFLPRLLKSFLEWASRA